MAEKNQKLRLLKVLDILKNETDDNHTLSTNDIISKLENDGYECERRTLYDDVKLLNEYGINIETERIGKGNGYYIADEQFEVSELKIIVDALHAANFITNEKTDELINKVAKLGGKYKEEEIKKINVHFNNHKHSNKSIFYNVDTIAKAISQEKKISFNAFDLNYKGEPVYRHKKKTYIEEPLALIHNEDNYYVLIWSEERGVFPRRIDRLSNVCITEENICEEALSLSDEVGKYSATIFKMYSGKRETLTLEFTDNAMGSIHDKFGEKCNIEKITIVNDSKKSYYYRTTVDVEISPTFWGWFSTFAGNMKIVSPKWVIDEFNQRQALENTLIIK